jgi:hypothetical protein
MSSCVSPSFVPTLEVVDAFKCNMVALIIIQSPRKLIFRHWMNSWHTTTLYPPHFQLEENLGYVTTHSLGSVSTLTKWIQKKIQKNDFFFQFFNHIYIYHLL